jgi:diguanylate cyclase (GGDEF)-like protein/PAS domain S-box-containing protein
MVERLGEGVYISDRKARFVFANPAMEELFGVTKGGLAGRDVSDFLSIEQRMILKHQLKLRQKKIASDWETVITRPDGQCLNLLVSTTPRLDQEGKYIGAIGICRNITQTKQMVDKIKYQNTHDILTGLYNRNYFEAEMERLQKSRQFPISILMIDVDGLKKVNDLLGHPVGDDVLRRSATVLTRTFRPEDVVARIGGDEFVVILPDTDSAAAFQAEQRLKTLLKDHNQDLAENPFLSLSIGVACGNKKSQLSEVLAQADRAMYAEKASKGNKTKFG